MTPIAGLAQPPAITATVTQGAGACHTLQFPHAWTVPPALNLYKFWGVEHYEFRRPSPGDTEKVYVTKSSYLPPGLSSDKYLVDLTQLQPLLTIGENDWAQAAPVEVSKSRIPDKELQLTQEKNSFSYRGHEYVRKGRYWAAVGGNETRLSKNGAWLSVHSFRHLKPPERPDASPERDYGEFYIEVYNTASGEKKVEITGHYDDAGSGTVLTGLRFIEDRFLFVPTDDENSLTVLVCDLEKANRL